MKQHANDNLPILCRHPRLLAKAYEGDGNRQRKPERDRDENSEEDTRRELAVIEMRTRWINLFEWMLMRPNKRTIANDGQVRLSQSGREMAS